MGDPSLVTVENVTMDVRRRAGWLPAQEGLEIWLETLQERVEHDDAPLHPSLVDLQKLIDADPMVRMYVERMLNEEPQGKPYSRRHIHDVAQLLRLMNAVLRSAPEFSTEAMVITPLNAVLDWAMGTTAGFAAFRDPRVDAALKKVLRAWCDFLDSPASLSVLNGSDSGWMSRAAQQAVGMDQYEHEPDAEHWGFTSWNDFFTRRFRAGERPVGAPDDDKVVVSPCESTPYGISDDVRRQDQFWVKDQSYSLQDLLAGDPAVDELVGGTVHQADLSATNYHRWHRPVAGTVVRAFVVDGTSYSEADTEGAGTIEPQNSQGYMAHVTTRAVIILDADDPASASSRSSRPACPTCRPASSPPTSSRVTIWPRARSSDASSSAARRSASSCAPGSSTSSPWARCHSPTTPTRRWSRSAPPSSGPAEPPRHRAGALRAPVGLPASRLPAHPATATADPPATARSRRGAGTMAR
ncbi:MAG: phosphatidylserine decarboxylase family protein [Propionibacteriaceae bacterium]|nr:MAG: phosphatidylserine decarboxylase family protein [Propionibacteriaceae bacterium]